MNDRHRQRGMAADVSGAVSAADESRGSARIYRTLANEPREGKRGEGKGGRGKRVVTLTLPWPPSVNTYWRRRGPRYFVSAAGVEFREAVRAITLGRVRRIDGPVILRLRAEPPDNRRRDLDNVMKALLDGLQHGGVYADDSQVKRIEAEMFEPVEGGRVIVTVEER